jgi:hypothetical protein
MSRQKKLQRISKIEREWKDFIICMSSDGMPMREIAEEIGCSLKAIFRILRKYEGKLQGQLSVRKKWKK